MFQLQSNDYSQQTNGYSDFSDKEIEDIENVPIHLVSILFGSRAILRIYVTFQQKILIAILCITRIQPKGETSNFERQLKKAKRVCNEGFIRDIEFNPIYPESKHVYFRSKCKPSMRQSVQIGNTGKTATHYTLHVNCIKKTGLIFSAQAKTINFGV